MLVKKRHYFEIYPSTHILSNSYVNSKMRIQELLKEGIRSVGWDFSANIARAEQDGCEYVDELRELAERITTAE